MNIKKLHALMVSGFALSVLYIGPVSVQADTLYRQLEVGSTGSDVSSLQSFLALDYSIYPQGRVTGYFGSLTKSAVERFQTRNNISAVGRVGPVTLDAINARMGGGVTFGADVSAPILSSVNTLTNNNSASVSWSTNEASRGSVYYSTSPLAVSETLHSIYIGGNVISNNDTSLMTSQTISIPNLQSNTTYYYMAHSMDSQGNVNVSWPSVFRTN